MLALLDIAGGNEPFGRFAPSGAAGALFFFELVEAHRSQEFASWAPKYFEETSAFQRDNNYVFKFLTAGPEDNKTAFYKYYVQYRQGAMTNLADVKKSFENYMK